MFLSEEQLHVPVARLMWNVINNAYVKKRWSALKPHTKSNSNEKLALVFHDLVTRKETQLGTQVEHNYKD